METKEKILDAALVLAEETHYQKLSRRKLAKSAEVSESTVQYHFRHPWELRYATLLHAIRRENVTVLGQGLGAQDPTALSAPIELRERALKHIRDAAEAASGPVPSSETCEFAKRM
jgi:AcrR family transcriptional regulator